ncbi:NAD-binding protein [Dictyocaulus viviparus]|uniref:Fatty acyl-CoA reductase n=1 Tax=Dictyocaulus viviparus TaxID=29172 RepID=A0A0D8XAR5_DICVI|nr:NAD-binding protein [Dictyocaulus viviparus]
MDNRCTRKEELKNTSEVDCSVYADYPRGRNKTLQTHHKQTEKQHMAKTNGIIHTVNMSCKVEDVYSNRCVLLTGSTGFLGKVLVEKLLWALPSVGQLFLLIRPVNDMTPKERLDKVLQDPLFDRIRENKPHLFNKLLPISGDLMENNLGLNHHDMQKICDQVSIVIHSAATVKFDEKLRDAIEMNVIGTTRLIALCHKMKKLIPPYIPLHFVNKYQLANLYVSSRR